MSLQPFSPAIGKSVHTQTLSATQSSGSKSIDRDDPQIRICNAGGSTAFIRWGVGAQTAVTTDMPMLSGTVEVFNKGIADTIAAICASGQTATLYLTLGNGQ